MIKRNRQDSRVECLMCVMPYASELAKQLATGDIPRRIETRNPSSRRW
jgi:hypothetical protein